MLDCSALNCSETGDSPHFDFSIVQVPQFRPQAALHMLGKLLQNEMISPPFPGNETLTTLSNHEFHQMMNKWTESAQTAPFVTAV
jgi:hypothetical protein